jgi:hypothetical protein
MQLRRANIVASGRGDLLSLAPYNSEEDGWIWREPAG